MQEKAHACANVWGNLKGKHVERYGDLTPMDMSLNYKNLYELTIVKKLMCYDSLSHIPLFFTIEDVCIWLKKISLSKGKRFSMYAEILKWTRKEAHA